MGLKRPRITLDRADASTIIKRAVPSRARVALSIYDHTEGKVYRWLPDYSRVAAVFTKGEVEALWKLIEEVIAHGAWRDDGHRDRVSRMGRADGAASSPA